VKHNTDTDKTETETDIESISRTVASINTSWAQLALSLFVYWTIYTFYQTFSYFLFLRIFQKNTINRISPYKGKEALKGGGVLEYKNGESCARFRFQIWGDRSQC